MLFTVFAIILAPLSLVLLSSLRPTQIHDLDKIPRAHFSVPFTRLWLLWVRWNGRENRTRLKLHRQLGTIVRMGPKEVSINCIEGGTRLVYGSEFAKDAWYPQAYFGVDKEQHTARKTLLSALYTNSYILKSPELKACLSMVLSRFEHKLESWSHGDAVDILEQMRACMMDITTPWLYGADNGTDFLRDRAARDQFLSSWRHAGGGLFWRGEFFRLTKLAKTFGIPLVPNNATSCIGKVQDWGAQMTDRASSSYTKPGICLYKHFRNNFQNANPSISPRESDRILSAELLDHAIASHDVGGITLTYIMYELSKHPVVQQNLRAELRNISAVNLRDDPSLPQRIEELPLLEAIVNETLRLHAPSPGPLPRVVPHHGCRLDERFEVPSGTIVSATGYTLHRNETVFPHPEMWQPRRWLTASEADKVEMNKWFWAFGSGARKCVAMHFALHVIKAVLAKIYTEYETMLEDDFPLDQADATISGPIKNSLYLRIRSCE